MNNTGYSQQNGSAFRTQRPESKGFGNDINFSSQGLNTFSTNSNPASLKGKIQSLEEMAFSVNNELQLHKKELAILNSEKDSLSSVLNMKAQDVKKTLMNELIRLEDEMNRHFNNQKSENNRIQSQLSLIKTDKAALDELIGELEGRIKDLEYHIGNKESN
ncbi:hypothetical protein ABPG72_003823 [Tetrahymena utriculariae]